MSSKPGLLTPLLGAPTLPHHLVNVTRGVVLATTIEPALDSETRRRGLLGRDGLPAASAIIIAPSNAVHTFGMRFPIDLLFVRKNGQVVKHVVNVPPRRISVGWRGYAVIEFCANHPGVERTEVGELLEIQAAPTRSESH